MPTTDQNNNFPHFFFALRTKLETEFIGKTGGGNPPPNVPGCCVPCTILPALAQTVGSDPLKNDYYTAVHKRLVASDAFTYEIEKSTGGVFGAGVTLVDGVHGTAIAIDEPSKDAYIHGFTVEWQKILNLFGEGNYRIKATGTGLVAYEHYSFIFCLKEYTDGLADKTCRFDWTLNGEQPDVNSWRFKAQYTQANIPCSLRVVGLFGYPTAEYTEKQTDYVNGQTVRHRVETAPSYTFKSGRYWYILHNILMFNAVPSDSLKITDYCKLNKNQDLKQIPVLASSGYAPNYEANQSLLSRVTLEFRDKQWDFERHNC